MKKLLLTATMVLAFAVNANAYDRGTIALGLGMDNLRDSTSDGHDWQAAEARAEYRFQAFDNVWGIKNISPLVGVELDTQGAGYVYAGLLYDWNFYDRWYLVPNISAGFYEHGSGKDLGGPFNFHDSLELDYGFTPSSRLGLEFTHMSSAGINSPNPGKEDLMVMYSLGL